ncbi:hypothetical protein [Schlesneria paludicola]|uniref:hypothetical protein n=1 Tax=Schlesneria paludicola TaxID=360056 RepID=UPI00029B1059|nr:hypothetical protein [Schlesneria paludicola]
MHDFQQLNRRQWLGTAAGALSLATLGRTGKLAAAAAVRPRVAAVLTEFTYRSHAHVILENFLEPYLFNGQVTESGMDVPCMYVDQFPEGRDLARDIALRYGIKIYPTIAEALTCGGDKLAVDAVLSIGEHGKYPINERGQQMYPRKEFFDQIAAVFRQSGRSVPVFNDKHLSYRWDWSVEMMQTAQELKIPFMAGSSVPLAQRRPPFEMPSQAVIEEAVSVHSGGMESYDFHAMEVLQSLVESRKGGETGVKEIQVLEGDAVWKAADEGRWNESLAAAAMKAAEGKEVGPLRTFVEPATGQQHPVHVILITYRDGLKATVVRIGASATRWCFACKVAGNPEPLATSFYVGPWQNRNLFKALSHAIQVFFREGKAPYPVERTHLVTGMLAAAMDSHFEQNKLRATPQLDVIYQPTDYRAMREMGASWKIVTEETPEAPGIDSRRSLAK